MTVKMAEFHSYHATEETDHGVLESGIYKGGRFITFKAGCGSTPEEAQANLESGHISYTGYSIR